KSSGFGVSGVYKNKFSAPPCCKVLQQNVKQMQRWQKNCLSQQKNTLSLFLALGPVHVLRLRLVMFRLKHCVVVMRLGRAKDAFSGFNTLTQFGLIVVFC
ncbi:MAG: hypothetical protein QMC33_04325, partial [Octadecabacter sp.]